MKTKAYFRNILTSIVVGTTLMLQVASASPAHEGDWTETFVTKQGFTVKHFPDKVVIAEMFTCGEAFRNAGTMNINGSLIPRCELVTAWSRERFVEELKRAGMID